MPLSRIGTDSIEAGAVTISDLAATGTPSETTFLRGDNTWSTAGGITSGTVVTASSTSVPFTSLPSSAKRITLLFRNVSTSGTSNYQIQLGSSAGYVTTGYNGTSMRAVATATGTTADTTGFRLQSLLATATSNGIVTFSTYDNLTWYGSGNVADNTNSVIFTFGGAVTLPGVLDRIRITTVNGTDTFDGGTISTMFE